MFSLISSISALFVVCSLGALYCASCAGESRKVRFGILGFAVLSLGVLVFIFFTPEGRIVARKMKANAFGGNYFVADFRDGEMTTHWVLQDKYVKGSRKCGWEFADSKGNLCKVSTEAMVILLSEPVDDFKEHYQESYNVPRGQETLF